MKADDEIQRSKYIYPKVNNDDYKIHFHQKL